MMARPKSEDKRNAILEAATTVFAERGVWLTPTSAISKAAGVAEGTLFTYFATKEILVNELYRALKRELAETLFAEYSSETDARTKCRHIWQQYVHWGVTSPAQFKVLAQLQISDQITEQSKAMGTAPFAEIERLLAESVVAQRVYAYPLPFIGAMFMSMVEATITLIAQNKQTEVNYSAMGFEVFWRGIARVP
jgi:AcrR family transcriptional regulator